MIYGRSGGLKSTILQAPIVKCYKKKCQTLVHRRLNGIFTPSTKYEPLLDVTVVLLFNGVSPGFYDYFLSCFRYSLAFKSFPDKRKTPKRKFVMGCCAVSECSVASAEGSMGHLSYGGEMATMPVSAIGKLLGQLLLYLVPSSAESWPAG